MKKLINRPEDVVREMLEGAALLNPGVALLANENVIVRADLPQPNDRKVAVLSGGGSGHEPAHAGFVGEGMLTAAIAGDVFTSPSTDAVLGAIRAVSGPAGAVLIVKNYTGDRLNFGLAAELARAEGIPVEVVLVSDDVALRETVPTDRRRGIAGTVLVHKVAGAAADQGMSLDEVAGLARQVAGDVVSMGISLGACTLPAVGKPGFILADDEIEVGLGIHGEQGVSRMPIGPVDGLCSLILDTMNADRPFVAGTKFAVVVNGLGTTPPMELSIVARSTIRQLRDRGVTAERAWAGTFMSALDMPGFSLSILPLNDALKNLLDAPTTASAWPRGGAVNTDPVRSVIVATETFADLAEPSTQGRLIFECARAAANALIATEPELTELDRIAGDGDLGTSMKRGGEAILAMPVSSFATPADGLANIGNVLRRVIGGSSGPFYATGFLRAARELADLDEPKMRDWANAFSAGVAAISELGGAKLGDRTMIDALKPAADKLMEMAGKSAFNAEAIQAAAKAAAEGAEATKSMAPRLGRASYLNEHIVRGHPDGGAVAVSVWLKAIS
ncbi:MAG: dihydroxyacetone kinase subunit DhaK [Rhizobiales bacterium]|nr:dihydroxyacetone kinase subunit DhaK [Hyphomicrobiales bacterium]